MRTAVVTIIVLAAMVPGALARPALACHARTERHASRPAAPPTLVNVVSRDTADKGSVPLGSTVGRRIEVRNVTDRPVLLSVASKSCECMEPAADPPTIEPGQTSVLTFAVPAVASAERQVYTTVFKAIARGDAGETFTQEIVVRVRYTTDFEFVVKPNRLDLTAVQRCQLDAPLYLQSLAPDGLVPASPASPWTDVALVAEEEPALEDDGEVSVWALHLRGSPLEAGFRRGEAVFEVRGARAPNVTIPVSIRVLERWQAVPPGVVWRAGSDDPVAVSISLRDRCAASAVGRPAGLRASPGVEGVTGRLVLEDDRMVVTVTVDPGSARAPAVGCLEVLDAADRVVGRIPIVLYAPTDAPAGAPRRAGR
jgi:hypothetical protein